MVTLDLKKCQFKKCKRSVFMGRRLCSRHMEHMNMEHMNMERRVEHMDINLHMNINHIPVIITIMI